MRSFPRIALACILVAASAHAQGTMDTVELVGGGLARGTIVELVPQDHVTIQLPTGAIQTFKWSEVVRIVQPTSTPTSGGPPPNPPPNPPPEVRPDEPRTRVNIESTATVSLYRMDPKSGDIKQTCISPCNEELPATGTYWVSGKDINASNRIQFPANRPDVRLSVSGGSKGVGTAGLVLAGVGGLVALLVGFPPLVVGASYLGDPNRSIHDASTAMVITGVVAGGIGVAIGIIGLIIWAPTSSSSLTVGGLRIQPQIGSITW